MAISDRPGRGEGRIRMALPMARLLDHVGVGAETFIALVRSGELDLPRRPHRFTGADEGQHQRMRDGYGRAIPDPLPPCEGSVTWRRTLGVSRVDFKTLVVAPGVRWNEMQRRGGPPATLTLDGRTLPETLMGLAPGRPLRDFVDHPAFADERIVIVQADCRPGASSGSVGVGPTLTFRLEFPDAEYDDPGDPRTT